ncbi:MAG: J domain-containing protein [Planctomycetaceae bacterium]|nr:J domain-containing protein [Planctomycetaceae bacterium]
MDARKILGVSNEATPQEIRRAYREKAQKHHPDQGGDSWAFQQVQDAYDALSNGNAANSFVEPNHSEAPADQTSNEQENTNKHAEGHPNHGWRNLFTGQLPLQNQTTVFILINCLDIFMTHRLLFSVEGARETNPFAQFFIDQYGFNGAIAFKLLIVSVVCVIAQIVAIKKVRTARFLLNAGSTITGIVVVYSFLLYLNHTNPGL